MRTEPIDAKRSNPWLRLASAVVLMVTLASAAQAQERVAADVRASATTLVATVERVDPTYVDPNRASGKGLRYLEEGTQHSEIGPLTGITVGQSMTVGANFPDRESWDGFRHSVSGAATSSCFGPDALSHEEFAVEGLLRLPFLMRAASAGACR